MELGAEGCGVDRVVRYMGAGPGGGGQNVTYCAGMKDVGFLLLL